MSFFGVCSPLLVSFSTLIIMSFNSKGGNKCKYFEITLTVHISISHTKLSFQGGSDCEKTFASFYSESARSCKNTPT